MIKTTLKKEVIQKYMSPYFFETGTANGDAVRLALEVGFEKIFSVEIDENLYNENCEKFKKEIDEKRVFLFLGDTFYLLPEIIEKHIDKQCTFWLDAHQDFGPGGVKRCPLLDELDHIKNKKELNHVFLIDDRRMFGGDWWGAGITEDIVINKIKEIDQEYIITFEDGIQPNDVITAKKYK